MTPHEEEGTTYYFCRTHNRYYNRVKNGNLVMEVETMANFLSELCRKTEREDVAGDNDDEEDDDSGVEEDDGGGDDDDGEDQVAHPHPSPPLCLLSRAHGPHGLLFTSTVAHSQERQQELVALQQQRTELNHSLAEQVPPRLPDWQCPTLTLTSRASFLNPSTSPGFHLSCFP